MNSIRNPQSQIRNFFAGCLFVALAAWSASAAGPEIVSCRPGLGGMYKVGVWTPVRVTLRGGEEPMTAHVVLIAPDNDGAKVSVASRPERPVSLLPGREETLWLHTRIGHTDAALEVQVLSDEGKRVAQWSFVPNFEQGSGQIPFGQPASSEFFVEIGPRTIGLGTAIVRKNDEYEAFSTAVTTISRPDELPVEWYDYEATTTIVLSTSAKEFWSSIPASDPRITALKKWVELGGKLVVLGGANGAEVFASGGPLAELIPGRFDTVTTLDDMRPLEQYSGSSDPISPKEEVQLSVTRLVDVTGRVEAHARGSAEELPLVIRGVRGLGELTFVGVDLDRPPLRDWKGQGDFLRRIVRFDPDAVPADQSNNYAMMSRGYDDLAGALVKRLGGSFANVSTPPFAAVVGLVLLYLALIGPGDYFFVKRVLKRMEATWITFPAIVILTSVGAYWLAHYLKGDQLRINQIEVVDIDQASGVCRGTMWTEMFSPRSERYNLTVAAKLPDGSPLDASAANSQQTLAAWMGLPGRGLSGMHGGGGGGVGLFGAGYRFEDRLSKLGGLPVQVWSTKSLTARWDGTAPTGIDAELTPDGDMVVGRLTNNWDTTLDDCRLFYGPWSWRLGELKPNQTIDVDDSLAPKKLTTHLRANFNFRDESFQGVEGAADVNLLSTEGVVEFMMFAHALGGAKYTKLPNNYQGFLDLSHLLDDSRAILLCKTNEPRSEFLRDGKSMNGEGNRHTTMYRFVLEVADE